MLYISGWTNDYNKRKNIYKNNELIESSTVRNFRIVQKEGREIQDYSDKKWFSEEELKEKLNALLEFEYPDIITEIEEWIEVLE